MYIDQEFIQGETWDSPPSKASPPNITRFLKLVDLIQDYSYILPIQNKKAH